VFFSSLPLNLTVFLQEKLKKIRQYCDQKEKGKKNNTNNIPQNSAKKS
jgi:hypothetical protein